MNEYVRVYQTWNLVSSAGARKEGDYQSEVVSVERVPDFRHRVQMARIERSWSILELSSKIGCDVDTLAAFERGDDILSADLRTALSRILELSKR